VREGFSRTEHGFYLARESVTPRARFSPLQNESGISPILLKFAVPPDVLVILLSGNLAWFGNTLNGQRSSFLTASNKRPVRIKNEQKWSILGEE
jgi:hypothetical protein